MNLSAGVAIHLLGRPRIEIDGDDGYRFRSRKSWALLAFLLLAERPPTRSRLASLLFSEADDPLRALRWCLAEVRRGLGPAAVVDGDPVQLTLPPGATVDVDVLDTATGTTRCGSPGSGSTCSTVSPSPTRSPSSPGCSPSVVTSRLPRSRSCTRRRWGCSLAEISDGPVTSPSRRR